MKQVAGKLKLDIAQYREKAAFAQFGSDLDDATQRQLARGGRLVEILKQGQYMPMQMEEQVISLYAVSNGYVDGIPVSAISKYEKELQTFMKTKHAGIIETIRDDKVLSEETEKKLVTALDEFAKDPAITQLAS
jgi:F-type H+-transporting ATPase subunit alpha